MLALIFYAILSMPGLGFWWWCHHALEPTLVASIPAPRVPMVDFELHPIHNDWRGFV